MIQRRGFLAGILAAGMAPAFVGAKVLMPVKSIWTPRSIYLDGITLGGRTSGAVYYVRSGASGAGTGESWANAFTTLTAAGATMKAGSTIYVADTHIEAVEWNAFQGLKPKEMFLHGCCIEA